MRVSVCVVRVSVCVVWVSVSGRREHMVVNMHAHVYMVYVYMHAHVWDMYVWEMYVWMSPPSRFSRPPGLPETITRHPPLASKGALWVEFRLALGSSVPWRISWADSR